MTDSRTHQKQISRRQALGVMAGAGGAMLAGRAAAQDQGASSASDSKGDLKGRVQHSVCKWCYRSLSLDELCAGAAAIGMKSVELLDPEQWPTLKQYGLTCAMSNGPSGIPSAWNDPKNHDELVQISEKLLPQVAETGLPNMIVFSGNRRGLSDSEGLENCARALKRITPLAEKVGVTVCMELLNSKVDHKDYQCDRTPWGVDLVKRIDSPRFKLLYDIYHMQIMEGDVIRTIRDNIEHIAHFHTGGVPGRHEIDDSQELYYPAVAKAIVETGFKGYVAQEFIPVRDPLTSLREAVHICDV